MKLWSPCLKNVASDEFDDNQTCSSLIQPLMGEDDLCLLIFFVMFALHSRSHNRAAARPPQRHGGAKTDDGGLTEHVVDWEAL